MMRSVWAIVGLILVAYNYDFAAATLGVDISSSLCAGEGQKCAQILLLMLTFLTDAPI